MPTSVLSDPNGNIPQTFALSQSYPNPFNPSAKFVVSVPEKSEVELVVYDILGKKVRTLVYGEQPAGNHIIEWNGLSDNNLAVTSGIYFVRMISGEFSAVQKIMLIK